MSFNDGTINSELIEERLDELKRLKDSLEDNPFTGILMEHPVYGNVNERKKRLIKRADVKLTQEDYHFIRYLYENDRSNNIDNLIDNRVDFVLEKIKKNKEHKEEE